MKFSILASGSEGNAALLTTKTTRLLIDDGLSVKTLLQRMNDVGEEWGDGLSGIIVSHAHTDHVSGLGVLLRHCVRRGDAVPIYITPMTAARLGWNEHPPFQFFEAGKPFRIGDIDVDPFSVLHDCADPVNWVFTAEGVRIGFSTDLGFVPPAMIRKFHGCQVIVLESNHDVDMLWSGTHPQAVKERVAGRSGHLSNDQASEYLAGLTHAPLKVVMGHISKDNNDPERVRCAALRGLALSGIRTEILIAKQNEAISVFSS